jgi:5-methylcytosine-specific restriction endonuclease McrA
MKRSPLKRGKRKPKTDDEKQAARAWALPVKAKPCRRCGSRDLVEAHHVIGKSQLKRLGHHHLLWDERNAMPLCRRCHERHETATDRIPRTLLTEANRDFASDLGLEWMLDRYYAEDGTRSRHPGWA